MSAEKKLQHFWTEFIELYKSLPVLWNVKCPEYFNREMKAAAYEELVQKLQEEFPDATRDTVTRKINTFRSNYRRDLKKVKASLESDGDADDVFQSTLWYFDLLSFLEHQEECQPSRSTMDYLDDKEETIKPPKKKKKRENPNDENTLIKLACEHLQAENLDSGALSKSWESQYQEMSTKQKILSRKMISDILYYGCLGQLQEHHPVELQQIINNDSENDQNTDPLACLTNEEIKLTRHQAMVEADDETFPSNSDQNQLHSSETGRKHAPFDEDQAFFDSIKPAVRGLNECQKFDFRIEAMRLLKRMKEGLFK